MTKREAGGVERAAPYYSDMVTGTKVVDDTSGAIVTDPQSLFEVLVQNDPDSAVNILVGNQFGQYVEVTAGQSITIPIDNLNKIFVKTAAGSATINWVGMT